MIGILNPLNAKTTATVNWYWFLLCLVVFELNWSLSMWDPVYSNWYTVHRICLRWDYISFWVLYLFWLSVWRDYCGWHRDWSILQNPQTDRSSRIRYKNPFSWLQLFWWSLRPMILHKILMMDHLLRIPLCRIPWNHDFFWMTSPGYIIGR